MPQADVILAVGPAQGGVGDAFVGTVAALRENGQTVVEERLPRRESPLRVALGAARRCWRLLKHADVVHVEFGSNDTAVFWFAVIAAIIRQDVVVVVHDPRVVAHSPGAGLITKRRRWQSTVAYRVLSPLFDRPAIAMVLGRSGAIVVLGPSAQERLRARTRRPVVAVALGAEMAPKKRKRPSECDYVLFAGYLGPHKGLETLIDAWASVQTGLRLVIVGGVGEGNLNWLESLRARGRELAGPLEWIGHVESEEAFQDWFDAAAVVVLPYQRSSPASGILVRAMAAGRCVVASRVEAVTDAIEDDVTGWLVDVGDVRTLRQRLDQAAASGAERDRLGAAAQIRAMHLFGWDQFVAGVKEAYELARQAR